MKQSPILLTLFLLLLLSLSSCVTQREVEYLQQKEAESKSFKEPALPDYKLKPNDELYIQVNSLDEEASSVFTSSKQGSAYIGTIQPYGASLVSYAVDKEGYLLLPVIGKILVKDKTTAEVSVMITDALTHILSQPMVSVKLVNRYVSVLGEVKSPGHFPYAQDKITIYDALGFAGDITDYGNREEVILVRNENGENIRVSLDLTQSQILASTYYNLRPNDIVYVKPMPKKFWGMRQFPFNILFSTITTVLLYYSIFN